MPDETYSLIIPFLDDDPKFAHGVEFGLLYGRMRYGEEDKIEDYFTTANQEQITLLANRLGWRVVAMEPWEGAPGDWTWFVLKRPETDRDCDE
jgi:hypothetical protein